MLSRRIFFCINPIAIYKCQWLQECWNGFVLLCFPFAFLSHSLKKPIKEKCSTLLKPYGGFASGKFEPKSVHNFLSVEYWSCFSCIIWILCLKDKLLDLKLHLDNGLVLWLLKQAFVNVFAFNGKLLLTIHIFSR